MALRANTNLAPHGVAAGSGSGKPAPGAEEVQQGSTAPAGADGGAPGTVRKSSMGTSETGMTQNEALLLVNFVKEGFASLSSRMDRSEKRREKESSTLMDFLKQSFSSLSNRMDSSEKAQEKRTEDLAERVGRSETAQEKSAGNLEKRMDRIEERQLKFFIWIMGCFGATVLVLGVPLYLPLFNLG